MLTADEMGLSMMFTSVAAAMIHRSLTEKVDLELPQSLLCRNTIAV